jgi:hypothetical protein
VSPAENDKPTEEATKPDGWNVSISPMASERFADGCLFWSLAWLGTTFGGGIFGIVFGLFSGSGVERLIGVIVGPVAGLLFAGICAIPVHLHFAFFTWAFWLGRFRVTVATLAGGFTGFLATGGMASHQNRWPLSLAAACVGAAGSGLAARYCQRKFAFWDRKFISISPVGEFTLLDERTAVGNNKSRRREKAPWQFSIRDLFIHFTAIAVLISLWTTFFTIIRSEQKQDVPPPVMQSQKSSDEPAAEN